MNSIPVTEKKLHSGNAVPIDRFNAHLSNGLSQHVDDYRKKRDFMMDRLSKYYEISPPNGAFYLFPKLPGMNGDEFVARAIENNLLVIPGKIFSHQDTHFRISYAASDDTLDQGVEILKRMALSASNAGR